MVAQNQNSSRGLITIENPHIAHIPYGDFYRIKTFAFNYWFISVSSTPLALQSACVLLNNEGQALWLFADRKGLASDICAVGVVLPKPNTQNSLFSKKHIRGVALACGWCSQSQFWLKHACWSKTTPPHKFRKIMYCTILLYSCFKEFKTFADERKFKSFASYQSHCRSLIRKDKRF